MQRRTFAQTLASLIMVPLLKMQPEAIDRHKLLAMFLDQGEYCRWDLKRPYIFGDFAYATDGRTMARIASSLDEADDETIKKPPLEKSWDIFGHPETQWRPFRLHDIPDLIPAEERDYATCPLCLGRRVSYGKGYPTEEIAEDLPDYDPDGNTIADATCEMCHGRPYSGPAYQPVGSLVIDYKYAKRLAEIPGCEVCTSKPAGYTESEQRRTVLFRSEIGIGGIVMPIVRTLA